MDIIGTYTSGVLTFMNSSDLLAACNFSKSDCSET